MEEFPYAYRYLLRAIDVYQGSFVVKCALQPGACFLYVPENCVMLNGPSLILTQISGPIVPLSRQAVEILNSLKPLTGRGKYLFTSVRASSRPMSDMTVLAALRSMGFGKDQMTGHGFRAMARTILDEVFHVRPEYIEHQLAHTVKDPNGRAYNRTTHVEERKKMMQLWSDYLDDLKAGAKIAVRKNGE